MKIKYKYIRFEKDEKYSNNHKTEKYYCVNNSGDYYLGFVKWYPQWRQYCFYIQKDWIISCAMFSSGCLDDISDFLKQINQDHKENNQ